MRVAAVGTAFPDHYYDQDTLLAELEQHWATRHYNLERLRQLHHNVLVGGRHLALPLPAYRELRSFGAANDAWIAVALEVGARALLAALEQAGVAPAAVGALFTTSVTGIATPSIDARLMNRVGLSPHTKRLPLFGLGCVAGAAGLARAADYVRAFPDQAAVLLSIELCSLTVQREDLSIPNLIATGLFGDGAAAVVVVGAEHPGAEGAPRVVATRSVFYPDTEEVMGWQISERGFKVVLSADVPRMVADHLAGDVDRFLAERGLERGQIAHWIAHPGGPRVLEVMAAALALPAGALDLTWRSLRSVGNLSSTSVLLVLRDTMAESHPAPGSYGLVLAMGPGFCSELVLLQW